MVLRCRRALPSSWGLMLLLWAGLATVVVASLGDRQPEFKECVAACTQENCASGDSVLPLQLRLMLWTCESNCDYICQHVITDMRLKREIPYREPILQFHGKWPFYRFLGMQEPCSVLFSAMNFAAHQWGLSKIQRQIPASYPLRQYYEWYAYFGLQSWIFSMIFHTRDFNLTEKLDYFGAGAFVFYGLFYTPIRVFRLDRRTPICQSMRRIWTYICVSLFLAHVSYLSFWTWDYTYNMAANVAAGIVQNILWSWFSVRTYNRLKKPWAAWPGLIVAWIVLAMSFELLDFPPWGGMVDAHSLWHLGTVGPTIWWYSFLVKDAREDITGGRLKE